MAYKRKYVKRKRTSRRGKTFRKTVAKIARRVVKSQSEHKYFDFSSATGFDYGGSVLDISAVTQGGSTDVTRSGDELRATSLLVNMLITVADATNLCRIICFKWKQDSGLATPGVGDILNTIGSTSAPLSPYVHDQRGNFTVMYDKTWNLVLNTSRESVVRKVKIKMGKKGKINFNGGGTTGRGKFYLLFISDSAAVPNPSFRLITRLNFIDP